MEAPAAAWPRAARTACSSDMRASAGIRGRPFGHASERATQRLKAENALVLVRRSCRGGARALPRHSELWSLARTRRGNLGVCSRCGREPWKAQPITRRALPIEGGSASCRLAASRRASSYLFLESAAGADERARLGREPQPHEIHIPRRAWSVRGGRGRFGAPAMPWASSEASSQVVRIGVPPARPSS